jgi:ABC-2 type transport system ATP-binding protein
MSEMALTADRLVVIGRGRLIAEMPVAEFIACNSRQFVRVRTATAAEQVPLTRALADAGAQVADDDDGAMAVTGLCAAQIGDLAASVGVVLHELSPQLASLEDAFMELTRDSVEFAVSESSMEPVQR